MNNPIKLLDGFITRKTLPLIVKLELKTPEVCRVQNKNDQARAIYNKHVKEFKEYKISSDDVLSHIKEPDKKYIEALIIRTKETIHKALVEKRVTFVNDRKLYYTDKHGLKALYSYNELAQLFKQKVGLKIDEKIIIDILMEEYKKWQLIR